MRIHAGRKIGKAFVEDIEFSIRDNHVVGDVILSGEEFSKIADAWRVVTGQDLEKTVHDRIMDLSKELAAQLEADIQAGAQIPSFLRDTL